MKGSKTKSILDVIPSNIEFMVVQKNGVIRVSRIAGKHKKKVSK